MTSKNDVLRIKDITAAMERSLSGDPQARAPVSTLGDHIDAAAVATNKLLENQNTVRIEAIEDALFRAIGGDLDASAPVSEAGDHIDAIATGINVLKESKDTHRIKAIEETLLRSIGGDLDARAPVSDLGDGIDAIATGINILIEEKDTHRIEAIEEMLLSCIGGDLEARAPLSGEGDGLDAIATGINILVDDIVHMLHERELQAQMLAETQDSRQQDLNALVVKFTQLSAGTRTHSTKVYETITEAVAKGLEVDRVAIWFYQPELSQIRCVGHYQEDGPTHCETAQPTFESCSLFFDSLGKHRVVAVDDARLQGVDGPTFFAQPQTGAGMYATIRVRGEIAGALSIEHQKGPRRWSLIEKDFAGSISGVIAQYLESRALINSQNALADAQRLARLGSWELNRSGSRPRWHCSDQFHLIFRGDEDLGTDHTPPYIDEFDTFLEYIHPEDRNEFQNRLNFAWSEQSEMQFEHRIITRRGAIRFVSSNLRSISDGTGAVTDIKGTTQDITQLALMRSAENARHAAEKANKALKRNQKALRKTVADLAHDVRTPLASVKLAVDRLQSSGKNNEQIAKTLKREIIFIDGLLSNLLALAQIEGDALALSPRPVNIGELLGGIHQRFGFMAEDRQIVINFALPEEQVLIEADSIAIEQAVANLVVNALQHAEQHIAILLYEAGGMAVIEVRDDGPGIDPHDAALLKKRYFRGRSPRSEQRPGKGLGLTIADDIVKRHGGALRITSHPEGGALAEIRLKKLNT